MNTHIKEGLGDRIFNGVTLILILLIIVVVAYPLYFVLVASMSSPTAVNSGKILLYPEGFSLIGYQNILQNTKLWSGYANTIFYTVAGTFLGVCCTIMAGYAFSRTDLPGRNLLMGLFVFTMYFSGGLIPLYLVVKQLHLINTRGIIVLLGSISGPSSPPAFPKNCRKPPLWMAAPTRDSLSLSWFPSQSQLSR